MKRSTESLEFEQLWSSLRQEGELIPAKDRFNPRIFKKFLPRIVLIENRPQEQQQIVRLMGTEVREGSGLDLTGMDINQFTVPDQLPIKLERQALYHDHPVGRCEISRYGFEGGVEAFYEVTNLPLWGANGERIQVSLLAYTDASKALSRNGAKFSSEGYEEEIFIDIGAGIPETKYEIEPG